MISKCPEKYKSFKILQEYSKRDAGQQMKTTDISQLKQ